MKGGESKVRLIRAAATVALLSGSLAGSVFADGGVLSKDEFTPQSYCHMKFPAIRPRTLDTSQPELKESQTGDVVDFYGPCDESPTGNDQVTNQRDQEQHHWKEYQNRG
jgi:hypothetical protein